MEAMRRPFQGVWNIIRFNWPYYVISISGFIGLLFIKGNVSAGMDYIINGLLTVIFCATTISILASYFIYDHSKLYEFSWLQNTDTDRCSTIVNINAGFDETSNIIKHVYSNCQLKVFDFYDPRKHTEASIKRARRVYPPFPGTQQVNTTHLPLEDHSTGKVFTIFAAHEIRDDEERIQFCKEIRRILDVEGQLIVTEHLRDTANFLVYNIGFFHFLSKKTWLNTFKRSGFKISKEVKKTPFITTFILVKDGTES
jgi:hypothetical protein